MNWNCRSFELHCRNSEWQSRCSGCHSRSSARRRAGRCATRAARPVGMRRQLSGLSWVDFGECPIFAMATARSTHASPALLCSDQAPGRDWTINPGGDEHNSRSFAFLQGIARAVGPADCRHPSTNSRTFERRRLPPAVRWFRACCRPTVRTPAVLSCIPTSTNCGS